MRIALVIGHHEFSKGAYSKPLRSSEWDFYQEVVALLTTCPDIFTHNPFIPGYTTRVKNTANRLDKGNYDLIISLHFNAAQHPSANGCETLYYYRSRASRAFAKAFSEKVTTRTSIKLRNNGLRALTTKNDRGFAMCFYPKAPVILVEPFFGTNLGDCARIQDPAFMATILDDFINDYTS